MKFYPILKSTYCFTKSIFAFLPFPIAVKIPYFMPTSVIVFLFSRSAGLEDFVGESPYESMAFLTSILVTFIILCLFSS